MKLILKASTNRSHLVKKVITNSRGHKQTVWVNVHKESGRRKKNGDQSGYIKVTDADRTKVANLIAQWPADDIAEMIIKDASNKELSHMAKTYGVKIHELEGVLTENNDKADLIEMAIIAMKPKQIKDMASAV